MSSTANGGKEKETMTTFTIDNDNNITGYAPGEAIPSCARGHSSKPVC
jgi:hypothetical protein